MCTLGDNYYYLQCFIWCQHVFGTSICNIKINTAYKNMAWLIKKENLICTKVKHVVEMRKYPKKKKHLGPKTKIFKNIFKFEYGI